MSTILLNCLRRLADLMYWADRLATLMSEGCAWRMAVVSITASPSVLYVHFVHRPFILDDAIVVRRSLIALIALLR